MIEILNDILKARKTTPRPKMLSDYYQSLAQLCWQGKYYLYHAHAFIQHYLIYKKFSDASSQDMQAKIDYLIMTIMSVPQNPQELDQREEIRFKLSSLISASGVVPDKKSLQIVATQ